MIRPITSACIVLVLAVGAAAQDRSPVMELSVSGTFSSYKQKTEAFGQTYESETQSYGVAVFRPGFLLGLGLSIEPEFQFTAMKGAPPCFFLSGNVGLTLGKAAGPFLLAGYGRGNSIPLAGVLPGRISDKFDVAVLNGGAGWKVPVGDAAALRLEYRFQKYQFEQEYPDYYTGMTTTRKLTVSMNNVFVGLSVFLFRNDE